MVVYKISPLKRKEEFLLKNNLLVKKEHIEAAVDLLFNFAKGKVLEHLQKENLEMNDLFESEEALYIFGNFFKIDERNLICLTNTWIIKYLKEITELFSLIKEVKNDFSEKEFEEAFSFYICLTAFAYHHKNSSNIRNVLSSIFKDFFMKKSVSLANTANTKKTKEILLNILNLGGFPENYRFQYYEKLAELFEINKEKSKSRFNNEYYAHQAFQTLEINDFINGIEISIKGYEGKETC